MIEDTQGRQYANAAEWMTEVDRRARAHYGPAIRRTRNTWSNERTAELSTSVANGQRETAVDGSAVDS